MTTAMPPSPEITREQAGALPEAQSPLPDSVVYVPHPADVESADAPSIVRGSE